MNEVACVLLSRTVMTPCSSDVVYAVQLINSMKTEQAVDVSAPIGIIVPLTMIWAVHGTPAAYFATR